jgi:hypothetical protein
MMRRTWGLSAADAEVSSVAMRVRISVEADFM